MRLPRLFSTTSFKLAALYALIFAVSAAIVGVFVYTNVKEALDHQERIRIQSDALALQGEYQNGGMPDMMAAIRQRLQDQSAGALDYSLFHADGTRIFGHLPRAPLKEGWKHLLGPPDGDEPPGELEQLLTYRLQLAPDLWLVVGDDIGLIRNVDAEFLRVFIVGLLFALALAVGGGILVSATFLQRIDSITRTAEAIIEGDIARRISLNGSGDDLDRLAATLNRMLDRIEALMDSIRHVSTDIAHDLRTPLGHLREALDDARERATNVADYRSAVARAIAKTDAILETFAAILRIAQIESGSRRAGFRQIDLSEIVLSAAHSFSPTAEEQNHTLVTQVQPGLKIDGDRELITQLLANLLDNAIRHTPDGTRIEVRLHANGRAPVLEIADNGPGVPVGERQMILDRFYRGEASRSTAGNGLGLSLVAAVAGLHGASVALGDNGPGLIVSVSFPAEANRTASTAAIAP
ncbi:MAG: ATP-binding protein [Rhizomicrobium sp.]